jgi:hypothetical protein
MIPKSVNRFSDKIMRKKGQHMIANYLPPSFSASRRS